MKAGCNKEGQYSGGSRGGAQGARPPLFWVKKRRNNWKEKGQQDKKVKTGPPLAQGLDPPLQ